jgi:hypothetical protein
MPISLPPLPPTFNAQPSTRRAFLARTATALAVTILAPAALAATRKKNDPNVWALLSDTHIAGDEATVSRATNMANNLQAVGARLLERPLLPAQTFVCGDLAYNRGESADYQTLLQLLSPLREAQIPIHLALGNHDDREHFFSALPAELRSGAKVKDKHVALVESARANWFMLDSLEATNSTPGLLGPDQITWLEKALDANPGKPALVITHHNPGAKENISGLKDTDALLSVLRPRKQVKAWFYGHTHHWNLEQDSSGIHLVNLPPTAYAFKEGDPSGWVLATLEKDHTELETFALDTKHAMHAKIHKLKYRT